MKRGRERSKAQIQSRLKTDILLLCSHKCPSQCYLGETKAETVCLGKELLNKSVQERMYDIFCFTGVQRL